MNCKKTYILLFFCLFLVFVPGAYALAQNPAGSAARADSTKILRSQYKNRSAWEYALSAPGELIYIPLGILLECTKETVEFVDDRKIIPRLQYLLISEDGLKGAVPTYSSRSGAGFRSFIKDWREPGSRIYLNTTMGLRRRQQYELSFRNFHIFDGLLTTDMKAGYRLLSDEEFYGIGSKTQMDDESNYAHEQIAAGLTAGSDPLQKFSFSLNIGIETSSILGGRKESKPSMKDVFSPVDVPGLDTGITLGSVGLQLRYDSRNTLRNTTAGSIVTLNSSVYGKPGNGDYGFWKTSVDVRQYLHLVYNRVFYFRFAAETTEPFSGKKTPFYHMAELGEKSTIRGYHRGRFRDNDMLLASVEYRYPVFRSDVDCILFFDAGQVAENVFRDINRKNFQTGYGFGFNLWGESGAALQFMVGFSREMVRSYLVINPEF